LPFFKFYLFFSLFAAMAVSSRVVRGATQETPVPDPQIATALQQISSQRIQSNIEN
jgi:hypothetical protein